MNSILQTTLFGDAFQIAKTNKRQFLEKMDSLIPWQDWVSIIEPIYYEGVVGQKPYPIELMLTESATPKRIQSRKAISGISAARHISVSIKTPVWFIMSRRLRQMCMTRKLSMTLFMAMKTNYTGIRGI